MTTKCCSILLVDQTPKRLFGVVCPYLCTSVTLFGREGTKREDNLIQARGALKIMWPKAGIPSAVKLLF